MTTGQPHPTDNFAAFSNDTTRFDLLMFGLACLIPMLHVTSEHVFYLWGYAGDQDLTSVTAHNILIDPPLMLRSVHNSTLQEGHSCTYASLGISASDDVSTLLFSKELPDKVSVNGIVPHGFDAVIDALHRSRHE